MNRASDLWSIVHAALNGASRNVSLNGGANGEARDGSASPAASPDVLIQAEQPVALGSATVEPQGVGRSASDARRFLSSPVTRIALFARIAPQLAVPMPLTDDESHRFMRIAGQGARVLPPR